MTYLFDILEGKEGQEESDINRAKMRLAAAIGLIKIASYKEYIKIISSKQFRTIAYTILDDYTQVRKALISNLGSGLRSMALPIKFGAILALGIGDEERDIAVSSKRVFEQWVKLLDHYRSQRNIQLSQDDSWKFCPEYVLPHLIHLLAHYPKWEEEQNQFPTFQRILFGYFDVIIDVNGSGVFPFFYKLLPLLKQRKDREDPSSSVSFYFHIWILKYF